MNKSKLILRIIAFPIKLGFTIFWFNLIALKYAIKWLLFGGQELYYGKEIGGNLVDLILSNEKLIKKLESNTTCNKCTVEKQEGYGNTN